MQNHSQVNRSSLERRIRQQIAACYEILSIDEKDVLVKIEHSLREEGWNEEDGYDRLRDEWDGYVHPQGYPVVRIISSFNLRVFSLFNRVSYLWSCTPNYWMVRNCCRHFRWLP